MNDLRSGVRIGIGALMLVLALAGLGLRLAFLHLGTDDQTRSRIDRRRVIEKEILAGRGRIYDRNGRENILALSVAGKDIWADPYYIANNMNVAEVSSQLADLLSLSEQKLVEDLSDKSRRYSYIKRFVPEELAVRAAQHEGVFLEDAVLRNYPHGRFMCHILGFVNFNGRGSAGVEQEFDPLLKGSPGYLESRVDAHRRELYWERFKYVPPLSGSDVFLTIDQNIQYITEQTLDETIQAHKAKAAWAVIQRVKTGEILAMVSRPAYDPNEFRKSGSDARLNRALGCVYEPGSTFKAVTVAAALNERVVTPETVFDCENGAWRYNNRNLHDYSPHGELSVAEIVKKSSNIGTAKIALKLGDRLLHDYARRFGVGEPLGIDLPGEEAGILRHVSGWSNLCGTRIAIGQGIAITALQLAGIYAAIANDGCLMKPYIVKEVYGNDGTCLIKNTPELLYRSISPSAARTVAQLLRGVTEPDGTGARARIDGYGVAGKTGTAQKVVDGNYSDTAYIASFAGFVPAENPEIAIVVVVDEPQPLHTGGTVAAPAFSRIAEEAMKYLNVSPTAYELAGYGNAK